MTTGPACYGITFIMIEVFIFDDSALGMVDTAWDEGDEVSQTFPHRPA
jgi:hypothetical protein